MTNEITEEMVTVPTVKIFNTVRTLSKNTQYLVSIPNGTDMLNHFWNLLKEAIEENKSEVQIPERQMQIVEVVELLEI